VLVAALAVGANDLQIARSHLLPNIAGPVIVAATFGVPQAIFAEAALSFIGLGVPLPTPTWGNLVVESKGAFQVAPHLVFASCTTVALTMMSFMLLGEGLRDALDPRMQRRSRSVPDAEPVAPREQAALPRAA
jgi:oligopeptide transport system permease protein